MTPNDWLNPNLPWHTVILYKHPTSSYPLFFVGKFQLWCRNMKITKKVSKVPTVILWHYFLTGQLATYKRWRTTEVNQNWHFSDPSNCEMYQLELRFPSDVQYCIISWPTDHFSFQIYLLFKIKLYSIQWNSILQWKSN